MGGAPPRPIPQIGEDVSDLFTPLPRPSPSLPIQSTPLAPSRLISPADADRQESFDDSGMTNDVARVWRRMVSRNPDATKGVRGIRVNPALNAVGLDGQTLD